MELSMLVRIMLFEPLYAATLPPPPPRLVRQNAERLGDLTASQEEFLLDSDETDTISDYDTDDETDDIGAFDLSDSD